MDDTSAPAVTDLRLVAVTPDRSHLVFEDSESKQFRAPIDERLANALRNHRAQQRPGQLEISLQSQLTPREIQARVRAGHTVDEVAAAAGISPERVERYAGPVLAEREHVVEQAQKAPARRAAGGKAPTLAEQAEARLAEQRVALDSVSWDAWRGDDDRWTVRLSYLGSGRARVATWTFDPRGRVLSPADDEARWLVDDSPERAPDDAPSAIRRLSAVPREEEPAAAGSPADEVYDREADEARGAGDVREPEPEPVRQAASGARHRRPHVPSWDDIMFGTRRRD